MKSKFLNWSSTNVVIATLQAVGVGASLGLAGCATSQPTNPTASTNLDINPITVRQDVARLDIPVAQDDKGLQAEDQRALSAFITDYKQQSRGSLLVSFPSGSKNEDAAVKVGEDIRRRLYGMLTGSESVAAGSYTSQGVGGPIRLSYERYVADMKPCPSNAEANLSFSWSNKASPGFGCAVNSNIAMMLADPGDVVAPPAMTPSDQNRRATALDKYRAGLPSATQRSPEERGVVSQALGQ